MNSRSAEPTVPSDRFSETGLARAESIDCGSQAAQSWRICSFHHGDHMGSFSAWAASSHLLEPPGSFVWTRAVLRPLRQFQMNRQADKRRAEAGIEDRADYLKPWTPPARNPPRIE